MLSCDASKYDKTIETELLTIIATIYCKIKNIEFVTPPSSFGATKNSIFKVIDVHPAVINYPASEKLIANSKFCY